MKILTLLALVLSVQYSYALSEIENTHSHLVNSISDTSRANQYFDKASKLTQEAKYDSSTFYFKKASAIYEMLEQWKELIKCKNLVGINLIEKGNLNEAKNVLNSALDYGIKRFGERNEIVAQTYFNFGHFHFSKGEYDKALEFHNKALSLRLELLTDNNPDIAKSYNRIGRSYYKKGKYKNAQELFEKSLNIQFKTLGKHNSDVAANYNNLGLVYWKQGHFDKALEFFNRALSMRLETLVEIHPDVAKSYNNIGIIYAEKGEYNNAMQFYNKALSLRVELFGQRHPEVANNYTNLGVLYFFKGDYDTALEFYDKALSIRLEIFGQNHPLVGLSYENIGIVYQVKGDYGKALDFLKKSLSIKLETLDESHLEVARLYINIGNNYQSEGDYGSALGFYERAVTILIEKYGATHYYLASVYNNIGGTYYRKTEYDRALEFYNKSLSIRTEILGENHSDIAGNYLNIGNVYNNRADYKKAIEYYQKSLQIGLGTVGENHPTVAKVLQGLGKTYYNQNIFDKALNYYQKSIISLVADFADTNIFSNPRLIKIISEKDLLNSLVFKAEAFEKKYSSTSNKIKDIEMSLSTYELALELIDNMRRGYKREGSKLFLGEETPHIYEKTIRAALKLNEITGDTGYQEKAFLFSGKSKSVVLLESLRESQAKQFAGIPDSLLKTERKLRIDLSFYDTRLQKELQKKNKRDSLKIQNLEDKLFSLNTHYQRLTEYLELNYPKYHDIKYQGKITSSSELQNVLDEKTSLIEYFIGVKSLYIFIVSKHDFDIATLPKDSTFQLLAGSLNKSIKKVDDKGFLNASFRLYNLLIKPIENKITSQQSLVIIPDGILHIVPFEALIGKRPDEKQEIEFAKLDYLLNKYEISYHYSATLYSNSLEDVQKTIHAVKHKTAGLTGFAPVFRDEVNNGVILPSNRASFDLASADSSLREITLDGKKLKELKYSEIEVQNIIEIFKTKGKEAIGFLHSKASEENFKAYAANYKYVHIATHGLINEDKPQLSGIIFSQPRDSVYHDDGILYSGETYNLDLNADLVVLSSCESGFGKLVRGEGMMALTRGFLYSGASNVIVSLWKVSDRFTSQLMVEFYKNVLDGKNYSQSLREAKFSIIKQNASPNLWSSFVLVGG